MARLGGDEFAVLLTHSSLTAALLLAERVRDEVRRPVDLDGLTAQVGCSIGVAVHPDHGATATELLKSADIAMYDAKRRRVGVAVFSTEGNEHTADRLVVLSELRRALEGEREVVMHYQPKVHAEHGAGVRRRGAGALAAPDPWPAAPGRLHGRGRAQRPDHPAHRPGAESSSARSSPAGWRTAWCCRSRST